MPTVDRRAALEGVDHAPEAPNRRAAAALILGRCGVVVGQAAGKAGRVSSQRGHLKAVP